MKRTKEERIAAIMKGVREADARLWRHPLAEATVSLLKNGTPVTVENLITRLEVTGDTGAAILRREVSEAAIERLREIVVKKD